VLFADVELEKGDHRERLAALGLAPRKKGRKIAFPQPCACFNGSLCRIYPERPLRCRAFACGVLLRVQSGRLTEAAGLQRITRARNQVQIVQQLLNALGETDENLPIGRRYANAMAKPIDLANDDNLRVLRSRLMRTMDQLMRILQKDFLTSP
jgi:Fe-S-cluster containining protein